MIPSHATAWNSTSKPDLFAIQRAESMSNPTKLPSFSCDEYGG